MDIAKLRKQVAGAISKQPTTITLYRVNKVDDGLKGYKTSEPYVVANLDILLNEASSHINNKVYSEGGTTQPIVNVSFMAVIDEAYDIKAGDYFMYNGRKYLISYPLSMFDIYWNCTVEVHGWQ
jgi:hypothetical protein